MEFLNKVELNGIVGNVRVQTYDDNVMARIQILTDYAYTAQDGTLIVDTSWHQVIAWEGKKIQGLNRIAKGAKLHVVGRIRYQHYTGVDGVDRTSTEILANEVNIIEDDEPER